MGFLPPASLVPKATQGSTVGNTSLVDNVLVVTVASEWGISGGDVYHDPNGAAPGEEAVLVITPTGNLVWILASDLTGDPPPDYATNAEVTAAIDSLAGVVADDPAFITAVAAAAGTDFQPLSTQLTTLAGRTDAAEAAALRTAALDAIYPLSAWNPAPLRKATDETVNNSSTTQADDELLFAIAANEGWVGEFVVFIQGDATADFKWQLLGPAGITGVCSSHGPRTSDDLVNSTVVSGIGDSRSHGASTSGVLVRITFSVLNGSTAGSLQLKWAQSVATVADTTVKAGSYLNRRRTA